MRLKLFSLLFLCFFLNACSQKSHDVTSTLSDAFFGLTDAHKSKQEINALPYASCYVKINDGAQIFMVLAFADPSSKDPAVKQLKWLSSDRVMLITEQGRLLKTLGLANNNLSSMTANNSIDPVQIPGKKPHQLSWTAIYDWQPNYRYNYTANLNWQFIEETTLRTPAWEKHTDYYQEVVKIPSLGVEFTNHFWLDKDSHQVVKSIQHVGPEMASIEMTILKPFSE